MLRIGLTGGIGSGKSAASQIFEAQGIHIVDADVVSREVVAPEMPALKEIATHFGRSILTHNKDLDRAKLRELIFSNASEKQWLEDLLHPIIREEISSQLSNSSSPYSILVSPLLLETNQHKMVDRILLIDVPTHIQIERSSARDHVSSEQIEKIIATQLSRKCKIEKSDDIICNDLSLAELKKNVIHKHLEYLELVRA